ncbi:hypothetical protein WT72_21550 [Burkholderia pseudomultivorans]|uniref:hypothetical protein n=1 Tax=Burkholderia pseudomultivorans TaxID=1207504 RepID=UPI0007529C02|nr:hypothetical protein [Burkholderia pseudomultivorans]KWI52069.1 hypothetical protein WT72_21550 [Burkholderia pseudomultivorans]
MYKVSLQAQGKFQAHHYIGKTALLLISVGKEYHEGDKLAATVDKINVSAFGRCVIAVADTLQRHNYNTGSAHSNYRRSRERGDAWLAQNAGILAKLSMRREVLRWDDLLRRDDYTQYYHLITNEYYSNHEYRHAINGTIDVFAERNGLVRGTQAHEDAFYRSLFYILEECPIIMPMWARDGIDFILYPKQMTSAMSKTREIFVQNDGDDRANWLAVKFKKKSSAQVHEHGHEHEETEATAHD